MVRNWPLSIVVLCLTGLLLACSTGTPASAPQPAPTSKPSVATTSAASSAPKSTPAPPAPATSPAAAGVNFAGKTITIVVGSSAGGSSDITARIYSRVLGKHLPGNPRIVVRNMPGAGGTMAANYVWGSKPDGQTTIISAGGMRTANLLKSGAAKYEMTQMTSTIGVMGTVKVFLVTTGIIGKAEDIVKAKGLIGGISSGMGAYQMVVVKELLDIPFAKMSLAYTGAADSLRAFISGETNFTTVAAVSYWASVDPLVKKGDVMLLFQMGRFDEKGNVVREPTAPPSPSVVELYQAIYSKAPSGTAWEAYKSLLASEEIDKMLTLPPGAPENVKKAYWDACEQMLKDPEFRQLAERDVGADAKWEAGKSIDDKFKLVFKMDPQIVTWFRDTMTKYGVVVE